MNTLALALLGSFAIGAHAGQTSAVVNVRVNIVSSSPVSVVSNPSTVVVCGTAALTGATGCGVITVPPGGGAGSNVPPPPPGDPPGNQAGSGTVVPVVPAVVPPVVAGTPVDSAPAGPAEPLPIARATLELLTVLQSLPERTLTGAPRDLFLLKDTTAARLESWRSRSVRVFSSSGAEPLSNVLGTSAEMRIVREVALNYTEMLVSW
jgi:hypothetical protein